MAGAPTTPYNSIYSYISPGSGQTPPPPKKGPCCLHGKECLKEEDEESAPYVNLLVPKTPQGKKMGPVASEEMSEERRNKNLRILAREMKTLQLGVESERHRKSHEKKKKKKSEDSSKKRSKSTKTDSEDSPNPLRSGGEDEERKEPSKPRKKKNKKRERSPDNRRTFGTDSSTERKKSRKKEKKKSRVEDSEKKESKKTRESRMSHEKKKHNRTLDFFPTREKTLQTSYLGVKTWKEAEAVVSEPSDFRLYHRMGEALLNELEPSLPLFLVYKAASGKYKHYRVRQVTVGETTTYMVEHGQMNAEVHASLEHLVRFYHTQFYRHEKNGEQQVDAFPCWSDSS